MKRIMGLVVLFCALVEGSVLERKIVFDKGTWAGAYQTTAGFPKIPVKYLKVLLPFGEEFETIEFETGEKKRITYRAEWSPIPKPLCDDKLFSYSAPKLQFPFPAGVVGEPSVVIKHGYRFLLVPLHPIQMVSETEAISYSDVEVVIHTRQESEPSLYRGLPSDREEIEYTYGDKSILASYPLRNSNFGTADYLVVAPKQFVSDADANSIHAFLKEKSDRGLTTEIQTVEDIKTKMQGRDLQEKIRNAIIDAYKNRGTKYVLLVGNGYSVTPTRILTVRLDEGSLPGDFYFACLDGDFDGNRNNQFGESDDGPNRSDVDLTCEVALGRAPANSLEDLHHFVAKSIRMGRETPMVMRVWNTLNFGEKLDNQTLGSKLIDHLVNGGKVGSVSTVPYPKKANFNKMYESFSREFKESEVIANLNSGDFYTVNHLGHANESYCMRFSDMKISQLTNPNPFFGITQGCHPGNLRGPNWASKLVNHAYGAAAMVANSNYGFYNGDGSDEGPSNQYHLMFWHAVFGEKQYQLGRAHYKAKELLIPQIKADPFIRWVAYETNLLGDPEIRFAYPR